MTSDQEYGAANFARAVLAAFEQAGHFTDPEVVAAGGPSTTSMTRLRKVATGEEPMGEPRSDLLRRIELAADWAPGSARALWRTGRPPMPATLRETEDPEPISPSNLDIVLRDLLERVAVTEERLAKIGQRLDIVWESDEQHAVLELRRVAADEDEHLEAEQEADDTP